jgi:uncharacterized membrane protein
MSQLEIFVWAIFGGLFVVLISSGIVYYKDNMTPTTKEISRNFILGAALTGILYPILPENLDGVKDILTAEGIPGSTKAVRFDSDVKVGPANF